VLLGVLGLRPFSSYPRFREGFGPLDFILTSQHTLTARLFVVAVYFFGIGMVFMPRLINTSIDELNPQLQV
jgi:hypothetical protein